MPVYASVAALSVCPQACILLAALPAAQTASPLHQYQIQISTWNSGIVINLSSLEIIYFFTGSLFLIGLNTIHMFSSSSQHLSILFHYFISIL